MRRGDERRLVGATHRFDRPLCVIHGKGHLFAILGYGVVAG